MEAETDTTKEEVPVPPQDETEITLHEALESFLTDEELCDFTLVGSDGGLVPVNQFLLASRSPFFRRMFFGKLKEAHEKQAKIGYDSKVLKEIVRYICTDKISPALSSSDVTWDIDKVDLTVGLMKAANYFALPELRRIVEEIITLKMKSYDMGSDLSPLILAACGPDCELSKDLQDIAIKTIQTCFFDKEIVALIHPKHIENIIKDECMLLNAISSFRIVQAWANATGGDNGNESDDNRKCIAAQMIKDLIRLEDIDISDLSTIVSESELVTKDQLLDAFKKQGFRTHKRRKTLYTHNDDSHWEYTGTKTLVVDCDEDVDENDEAYPVHQIVCPPLTSGVHKWGIKVIRLTDYLELGVASTKFPINKYRKLSHQRGGWTLDSRGSAEHAGRETKASLPCFVQGSIVSFTLDLNGGGVLTASIDDKTPFQLFSGMLEGQGQDGGEEEGFRPALGCPSRGTTIEFLGFEVDSVMS